MLCARAEAAEGQPLKPVNAEPQPSMPPRENKRPKVPLCFVLL
jgi:hypothetical protein